MSAKRQPVIYLERNKLNFKPGDTIELSGRLFYFWEGTLVALENVPVYLTLDGTRTELVKKTDITGNFLFKSRAEMWLFKPGTFIWTALFQGSDDFEPVESDTVETIMHEGDVPPPPPPDIPLIATEIKVQLAPAPPPSPEWVAVVTLESSQGNVRLKDKPIDLHFDGAFLSRETTDDKGTVTKFFGKVIIGEHTLLARFAGDDDFSPSEGSVSYTQEEITKIASKAAADVLDTIMFYASKLWRSFMNLIPAMVKETNYQAALDSIDPEKFKNPHVKSIAQNLKKNLARSPENLPGLMDAVVLAPVEEALTGLLVEMTGSEDIADDPDFQKPIKLLTFVVEIGALIGIVDVISTAVSGTLVRKVGTVFRSVMSQAGLAQLGPFLAGSWMGASIKTPLDYALNRAFTPLLPNPTEAFGMKVRGQISEEKFRDIQHAHGLNDFWAIRQQDLLEHIPTRFETRIVYEIATLPDEVLKEFLKAAGWPDKYVQYGMTYIKGFRPRTLKVREFNAHLRLWEEGHLDDKSLVDLGKLTGMKEEEIKILMRMSTARAALIHRRRLLRIWERKTQKGTMTELDYEGKMKQIGIQDETRRRRLELIKEAAGEEIPEPTEPIEPPLPSDFEGR